MREVMRREQPMTTGPGFENTVFTSFAAYIGNTNYQARSAILETIRDTVLFGTEFFGQHFRTFSG